MYVLRHSALVGPSTRRSTVIARFNPQFNIEFSPESPIPPHMKDKTCKSCKHFVNGEKCSLFGTFHLVTGYVDYVTVFDARLQPDKCGLYGSKHEPSEGGSNPTDASYDDSDDPTSVMLDDGMCYSPDGFHWLNCEPKNNVSGAPHAHKQRLPH